MSEKGAAFYWTWGGRKEALKGRTNWDLEEEETAFANANLFICLYIHTSVCVYIYINYLKESFFWLFVFVFCVFNAFFLTASVFLARRWRGGKMGTPNAPESNPSPSPPIIRHHVEICTGFANFIHRLEGFFFLFQKI